MGNILLDLGKISQTGDDFVLCILTRAKGSTPRKEGAKMLVFADGRIMGTIGGGAVEKQVIEEAIGRLQTGEAGQRSYVLGNQGGRPDEATVTIYFEPVRKELDLYVFGAGHVGREVGHYARDLGFRVHFADNRPEIFSQFRGDYARHHVGEYLEVARSLSFTGKEFVVITTQDHAFDEALVALLAPLELMYLGMIGSRRKVDETRRHLLENRNLTSGQLDRVDMPIGVPFEARTPREIALSIVARLVDVKNKNNL